MVNESVPPETLEFLPRRRADLPLHGPDGDDAGAVLSAVPLLSLVYRTQLKTQPEGGAMP